MKRSAAALAALLLVPVSASAAGLEITGYAGPIIPVYEQSVALDPSGLVLPGGGVLPAGQALKLEGDGGNTFGGALTLYLADWFGLEGRIDAADLRLKTTGATYRVVVDLPAPLPDATGDLELGSGPMDVQRIHPLSLNLKLRSPGGLRLTLSGGVSYLPSLSVESAQAVQLRAVSVPGVPAGSTLASVGLRAEAAPQAEENGRWGANLGLGLQIGLGSNLALVAEGRAFVFQEHVLNWRRADGPLLPIEEALARELERRLDPVEFNPNFFQVTAGLALSF
jgi:hypothetical protein